MDSFPCPSSVFDLCFSPYFDSNPQLYKCPCYGSLLGTEQYIPFVSVNLGTITYLLVAHITQVNYNIVAFTCTFAEHTYYIAVI